MQRYIVKIPIKYITLDPEQRGNEESASVIVRETTNYTSGPRAEPSYTIIAGEKIYQKALQLGLTEIEVLVVRPGEFRARLVGVG